MAAARVAAVRPRTATVCPTQPRYGASSTHDASPATVSSRRHAGQGHWSRSSPDDVPASTDRGTFPSRDFRHRRRERCPAWISRRRADHGIAGRELDGIAAVQVGPPRWVPRPAVSAASATSAARPSLPARTWVVSAHTHTGRARCRVITSAAVDAGPGGSSGPPPRLSWIPTADTLIIRRSQRPAPPPHPCRSGVP